MWIHLQLTPLTLLVVLVEGTSIGLSRSRGPRNYRHGPLGYGHGPPVEAFGVYHGVPYIDYIVPYIYMFIYICLYTYISIHI